MMTINRQSISSGSPRYFVKTARKTRSVSFWLSVFLIIYAVLYFYIKSILRDESVVEYQAYFSILANLLLFCFLFLKLFLGGKRIERNIKCWILLTLIFCMISYFVNFSGLEKLLGLSIFLMSIAVFQIYPLRKNELNIIFCLFVFAVILILLNGTTEIDSIDESKFNPNACGFLLALVFCVSLVRFGKSKRVLDFVMLLVSFDMQFFFTSRTAMLGCLMFFTLFVLRKFKKKGCGFKTLFAILLVLPLLGVAVAYIYAEVLYPQIGVGKIIIFGKDLFTGRQEIWHYTFESIKEHLWFGVGSHLNDDLLNSGFYDLIANAHNQSLGTIAAFGILPFVSFSIAFAAVGAFTYKRKFKGNKFTVLPVLFLAVICVMSWFDLYLFSQYNWVPIIISYGLICGYGKKVRKKS